MLPIMSRVVCWTRLNAAVVAFLSARSMIVEGKKSLFIIYNLIFWSFALFLRNSLQLFTLRLMSTSLESTNLFVPFSNSSVQFPTLLILSVFIGWTGADRFYLGYLPTALAKMFTLGGLGVWWLVDIVQVCLGTLGPTEDRKFTDWF
jgi:hypothetical protein